MNESIEIPNKSSFKMNEVCAITGVKSYVLRFWESEFVEISPTVSAEGLKLYEYKDIEAILLIKKLLFVDKLSVERARFEVKMLMPKEYQAEEPREELKKIEVDNDHNYQPEIETEAEENINLNLNSDLAKLVMAKSKLLEILNLTKTLHQKNNWK